MDEREWVLWAEDKWREAKCFFSLGYIFFLKVEHILISGLGEMREKREKRKFRKWKNPSGKKREGNESIFI